MGVVRCKPNVAFPVLAPAGIRILRVLDEIADPLPFDLIVSSGSEARGRLETDPHMTGEAVDVSVDGMTPDTILAIHDLAGRKLGPKFTVLFEVKPTQVLAPSLQPIRYDSAGATGPHFHLQRRRGTVFPPPPSPPEAPRA